MLRMLMLALPLIFTITSASSYSCETTCECYYKLCIFEENDQMCQFYYEDCKDDERYDIRLTLIANQRCSDFLEECQEETIPPKACYLLEAYNCGSLPEGIQKVPSVNYEPQGGCDGIYWCNDKICYVRCPFEPSSAESSETVELDWSDWQEQRETAVESSVSRANDILSQLKAAGGEGYEHSGFYLDEALSVADMTQTAILSWLKGGVEALNEIGQYMAQQTAQSWTPSPDELLSKGAQYYLEAHGGNVEARALPIGFPPQRFLYGCSSGKYKKYKCKRTDDGVYVLEYNGKKMLVTHFIRMKDEEGNIYWVGVSDPEVVESPENATIILREVRGWLWKKDNVEVIDPSSGKVLSEEDLPG